MARALVLVPVLLALLMGCGDGADEPAAPAEAIADFGVSPQRLTLEGAPASVIPPAGEWLVRTDHPGPGRTTEQFRRDAEGIVLHAAVFPVQNSRQPSQALPGVVDAFIRGRGTDGYGRTGRRFELVRGAPSEFLSFAAVVGGKRCQGHARLVLLDPARWALAIGIAPDDAGQAAQQLVRAFALSLEPLDVTFYERAFVNREALAQPFLKIPGEKPVLLRDVEAVQLVIELGTGVRFPLSARPTLRRALGDEAQQGSPASRAAFREVHATLTKTAADVAAGRMEAAEREAGMRALGQRILQQIFERARKGYAPARLYHSAWMTMAEPVVGTKDEGVSLASLQCLNEMSHFLASLAADREVKPTEASRATLRAAVSARWEGLEAEARRDLTHAGRAWARLRYAWDHASPRARVAFRQALLAALVAPAQRAEVAAFEDTADLLAWMHQHVDQRDDYARRAAELGYDARENLIALLDVGDAGPQVGW